MSTTGPGKRQVHRKPRCWPTGSAREGPITLEEDEESTVLPDDWQGDNLEVGRELLGERRSRKLWDPSKNGKGRTAALQSPRIYMPAPFLARAVGIPDVQLNTSFYFALNAHKAETFCQLEHEPNRFFGSVYTVLVAD